MSPTCLVPIADGSEELEFVSIVDTLVRAGVQVTVASVMNKKEVKIIKFSGPNFFKKSIFKK